MGPNPHRIVRAEHDRLAGAASILHLEPRSTPRPFPSLPRLLWRLAVVTTILVDIGLMRLEVLDISYALRVGGLTPGTSSYRQARILREWNVNLPSLTEKECSTARGVPR